MGSSKRIRKATTGAMHSSRHSGSRIVAVQVGPSAGGPPPPAGRTARCPAQCIGRRRRRSQWYQPVSWCGHSVIEHHGQLASTADGALPGGATPGMPCTAVAPSSRSLPKGAPVSSCSRPTWAGNCRGFGIILSSDDFDPDQQLRRRDRGQSGQGDRATRSSRRLTTKAAVAARIPIRLPPDARRETEDHGDVQRRAHRRYHRCRCGPDHGHRSGSRAGHRG